MATLVGKVGIVMKGNWSSSATYEVLDAVSYAGGLYIAKQSVPANTAPTNTTYWQPAATPTYKVKEFTYTYEQATSSGTQETIANAKTTVFGLTENDTIVGFNLVRALGNSHFCLNFNPVYRNTTDEFIFAPTADNSERLVMTGIVFYR